MGQDLNTRKLPDTTVYDVIADTGELGRKFSLNASNRTLSGRSSVWFAKYTASGIPGVGETWPQMVSVIRESRKPVAVVDDEVTQLKGEIQDLRIRVNSLEEKVAHWEATIARSADVQGLCEGFVKIVSAVDIIQQVYLTEAENLATIWTVIDAPPFEDNLRKPVYEAELEILRMSEDDVRLDFDMLNIQELPKPTDIANVIPKNAKLVWRR